jgi:hypothetical protein
MSPLRVRIEERLDDLGESLLCLAGVKSSSVKTKVCECKQADTNKSAILHGACEISCYRGVSWLHCVINCAEGTSGMRNEFGKL